MISGLLRGLRARLVRPATSGIGTGLPPVPMSPRPGAGPGPSSRHLAPDRAGVRARRSGGSCRCGWRGRLSRQRDPSRASGLRERSIPERPFERAALAGYPFAGSGLPGGRRRWTFETSPTSVVRLSFFRLRQAVSARIPEPVFCLSISPGSARRSRVAASGTDQARISRWRRCCPDEADAVPMRPPRRLAGPAARAEPDDTHPGVVIRSALPAADVPETIPAACLVAVRAGGSRRTHAQGGPSGSTSRP